MSSTNNGIILKVLKNFRDGNNNEINTSDISIKNNLVYSSRGIILISKVNQLPVKFGTVYNGFSCYEAGLTTLEGSPSHVGGDFNCCRNNLTSLVGGPKTVKGYYNCNSNRFISLSGLPIKIDGGFYMTVFPDTPLLKLMRVVGIRKFNFTKTRDSNPLSLRDGHNAFKDKDTLLLEEMFEKYYGEKNGTLLLGIEMMKYDQFRNNARC